MSPAINLEDMGLTLGITPDGKLTLEGLQQLNSEQREYALSFAREFKPVILAELRRRELAVMDDCPEPKAAKQEWVAAICACKFRDCTMWMKNKKPLECCWGGTSEETIQ